jgi:hypothetical protein
MRRPILVSIRALSLGALSVHHNGPISTTMSEGCVRFYGATLALM